MPTPSEIRSKRSPIPQGPSPDPKLLRSIMAALFAMATSAPLLSGCGGGGGAPVNADLARESLRSTLECWKRGDSIDSLKSNSPPIVAQDFDWMGGARLVAYELAGDGSDNDLNLRVPVKLTLKTAQGKEVSKSVTYVVGTSPSVTVFRDFQ